MRKKYTDLQEPSFKPTQNPSNPGLITGIFNTVAGRGIISMSDFILLKE